MIGGSSLYPRSLCDVVVSRSAAKIGHHADKILTFQKKIFPHLACISADFGDVVDFFVMFL